VVVEDPIEAKCDANIAVYQQFKIDFKVCDPKVTKTCETKLVQKMSGSPGYIDSYPLKIAFKDPQQAGVLTSFQEGFEILGTNRENPSQAIV
jgi:hypothetical protein